MTCCTGLLCGNHFAILHSLKIELRSVADRFYSEPVTVVKADTEELTQVS